MEDRPVAEHLEVLRLVLFRCIGGIEGVVHRRPLERALCDAVHRARFGNAGRREDRGCDIDDVCELVADLAACRDAVRPAHDRSVAGAAPVRGHLLGPLIRGVHRVCPADGVVVVGVGGAEVVDVLDHVVLGFEMIHVVDDEALVGGALHGSLGGRAVVADDDVDESVVEDAEVFQ